ncbi:MAG: putative motility protein [Deltaproteobacteria bacterium]|nr:putative motility protein [Deltaproteobacteria bacterium]
MNGISPEMTATAMDVAVMKKQKDVMEQQGQAAVELIQSAQTAPEPVRVAATHGLGRLIDVYI